MEIPSDRVSYGLNQDLGSWKDNRYVRCSRCGWINNLDRETRSQEGSRQGWGTDLSSTTTGSIYIEGKQWGVGPWGGCWAENVYRIDPVVKMGCAQCGCLLYNK